MALDEVSAPRTATDPDDYFVASVVGLPAA